MNNLMNRGLGTWDKWQLLFNSRDFFHTIFPLFSQRVSYLLAVRVTWNEMF